MDELNEHAYALASLKARVLRAVSLTSGYAAMSSRVCVLVHRSSVEHGATLLRIKARAAFPSTPAVVVTPLDHNDLLHLVLNPQCEEGVHGSVVYHILPARHPRRSGGSPLCQWSSAKGYEGHKQTSIYCQHVGLL